MAGKQCGPVAGAPQVKHGGQAVRDRRGPAFFAPIGQLGGKATRDRYGQEHDRRIGKQGGQASPPPGEGAERVTPTATVG